MHFEKNAGTHWYCKLYNKNMLKVLESAAKMQERPDKLEGKKKKAEEVAKLGKDLEEITRDVGMVRQLEKKLISKWKH